MSNIKVDVEYVLTEVKGCYDSLTTLKEILADFQTKYPEVLDAQISNEFIKEFQETLDEMKENITEVVEEGATAIIEGMAKTTATFLETDIEIAKEELTGGMS